jgi:hypothetical protein
LVRKRKPAYVLVRFDDLMNIVILLSRLHTVKVYNMSRIAYHKRQTYAYTVHAH